jgi:hypothetical protein
MTSGEKRSTQKQWEGEQGVLDLDEVSVRGKALAHFLLSCQGA